MQRSRLERATVISLALVASLVVSARLTAAGVKAKPALLAATPQLPGVPRLEASADWRQWDSFFTFIVRRFGQEISGEPREALAQVFLVSRYELTQTITRLRAGQNPVPQLYLNAWARLSPVINKALPALSNESASRYGNFIRAADNLAAVTKQGSQLGLLQLSPDALRALAQVVDPSSVADPIAYNLNVDSALRNLLGLDAAVGVPSSEKRQSSLRHFPRPVNVLESSLPSRSVRLALAAESDTKKLNQWVPDDGELEPYLLAVRSLLTALSDKVGTKTKLAEEHKSLYRHIVLTAAWQESCWRQFIKKGQSLAPLASASGDLGLMQVNRNTWRNLYDIKRLGGDIEYNGYAGGEILHYYLTRYAVKNNEHKQQGGNLARATYSAYNGGPNHLSRYRTAKPNPELKKVDEAFWDKFQLVSAGRELEVQRCYQR
jgi:hypothetical protein